MTNQEQQQTIGQWLESLATRNDSSEQDSTKMANLLKRVGFPNAVCTCGVVYLKGHGTIDAPPTSLHRIAQMLVDKARAKL